MTVRLKNIISGSFNQKAMRPSYMNNTVKITDYVLAIMI